MASLHRSPSYIVRNPYSNCFRMNVPSDLQTQVGKKELRYSLKTGYLGVAKSKARLMAGLCQHLFHSLRTNEAVMKLPMTEIQHIVNGAIRMFLEYTEAHRLFGEKKMDFSSNHKELSDLSDSMGIGLQSNKEFFSLSNLFNDAEQLTQQSLVDADYTKYERTVQTLIKMHNLDVEKGSVEYMQLSREFLKAYNRWATVEKRRNQGDYSDDVEAMFPISIDDVSQDTKTVAPGPSISLSQLITEFEKQKVESDNWRESTVRNHRPKMNAMLQVFGGATLVDQIGVQDARKYSKLLELLPSYRTCHPMHPSWMLAVALAGTPCILPEGGIRSPLSTTHPLW